MTEGNPPSSPPCFCTRKCRASADGGSAAAARTVTWGGVKGQREGGSRRWIGRTEAVCVCVCGRHSPVSHVVTAGEVEVLQPAEVRRSLGHPAVGDSRAVAEGQAGEAAAAPRYRRQAGVADVAQRRQG